MRMHQVLLATALQLQVVTAVAQPTRVATSEEAALSIGSSAVRTHIAYLTADELLGRSTPSAGLDSAAAYI